MSRPADLQEQIDLHRFLSLRVGGPAAYLAQPRDERGVFEFVRWAKTEGIEWTCLGGGTNLLVSDDGYLGLIIRTAAFRGAAFEGTHVRAAAGEPLSALARIACERGLSGLEWACGIPGTVGGAVVMNAGTREGETAGNLIWATCVGEEDVTRRTAEELSFGYRRSALLDGRIRSVVTEASFALARSTPRRTLAVARDILRQRERRFPRGATAGCTFRNPPGGPTAGELLDRAGCKGLCIGDVHVSRRHANFIVNDGSENASDVLSLIETMKRRVREDFDIELVEEIVIL